MKLADEIKIYLNDANDASLNPSERQSSLNEIRAHAPAWLSQILQEREVMVEALKSVYARTPPGLLVSKICEKVLKKVGEWE